MDSLLHIETKKQKLCQTDKDFNFHSVTLLSQAPLAGSNEYIHKQKTKHKEYYVNSNFLSKSDNDDL